MKSKNINACHLNVRPLPIKTILALSCVIMFTLTTLLSHLYVVLESDYLTNEIFLFTIDTVIMEVLENIVFAIVYSVIIYCAVLYTTRKLVAVCGIYLGLSVVRRAVSVLLTYITFREFDYVNPIFYIVIEAIQMLIVALISVSIGRTYRESNVLKKKAAQRMGSLYSDNALSFNSVFSFKNPLAVCALIAGIILSAIKVCMRIGADILYTMEFGAPDGIAEIVLMIAYYSSDILVCALVYTLSWLILRTFVRYDTAIIKD